MQGSHTNLDEFQYPSVYAFGVRWRVNGKKKAKFFRTMSLREAFVRSLSFEIKNYGKAALEWDPEEFRAYHEFKTLVGNADLSEVALCWARFGIGKGGAVIGNIIRQYLMEKEEIRISDHCLRSYQKPLERYEEAFGLQRMETEVKAEDLWRWLKDFDFAPVTTFIGRLELIKGKAWKKKERILSKMKI